MPRLIDRGEERDRGAEIENRGVDDGVPIDLRGSEIGEVAHMSFQG